MKGRFLGLVGAALLLSASALGGCVADATEEEGTLAPDGVPVTLQPTPAVVAEHRQQNTNPPLDPVQYSGGDDDNGQGDEPEPNPWEPQTQTKTGSHTGTTPQTR
jgi:hypothetical protein